ncbi:MAG: response regulator [Candidatus Nitrospinota bacterium M3_3B_026]
MSGKDYKSEKDSGRLEILVAEDNTITQDLLQTILESRGHSVTIARNGKEAVRAWDKGGFDIILMDLQMPEMDGLEAARIIRDREKSSGGRCVILAVTAYALDEYKTRCESAGMDGFITKPIDVKKLLKTLDGISKEGAALKKPPSPASATEKGESRPYDLAIIDDITGGNREETAIFARTFFRVVRERLESMKRALAEKDAQTLHIGAHTVKGMAGQFGAEKMRGIARAIEAAAGAGGVENLDEKLGELTAEFEEVKKIMSEELGAHMDHDALR